MIMTRPKRKHIASALRMTGSERAELILWEAVTLGVIIVVCVVMTNWLISI